MNKTFRIKVKRRNGHNKRVNVDNDSTAAVNGNTSISNTGGHAFNEDASFGTHNTLITKGYGLKDDDDGSIATVYLEENEFVYKDLNRRSDSNHNDSSNEIFYNDLHSEKESIEVKDSK